MNLYIMTRGRIGQQRTYESIPENWRKRTWLVTPSGEDHGDIPTIWVPHYVTNYSTKMEWIINDGMRDGYDKCVILDDDLVFSRRVMREDGKPGLQTLKTPSEINFWLDEMWQMMEILLDNTALVGIHPRQMGHQAPLPFKTNGKVICVQGVNRKLTGHIPDLSRFPILSDVVLNATLLSRGQGNKLITEFCLDWGSCQAPGGCSIYRTPEMQAEACRWLEERFGPYIKAVEKEAKNGWLGGKRVDFTGQWKRLYEAGVAGLLDQGKRTGQDEEGDGNSSEAVE